MTADLAFCEPSPATTFSRIHIRIVGAEGRMYGGGVPGSALCGHARLSWDVEGPVTVAGLEAEPCYRTVGRTCDGCAQAAICLLTEGQTTTDPRAHPDDNPETCTVCGDGVPHHDAQALVACGLIKETPNA